MKTNKSIICAEQTWKFVFIKSKRSNFKTKQYFEPGSAITDPEVSVVTIKQRKIDKKNWSSSTHILRSRMVHKSKVLCKGNRHLTGSHDNLHSNGLQTNASCLKILSNYQFPRKFCRACKLHSSKLLLTKYVSYFCEVVKVR